VKQGAHRESVSLLNYAVARGSVGEYRLHAAIAAVHDRAAHAGGTDSPQILALYGRRGNTVHPCGGAKLRR
jgi:predicted RNA polymerase sigma factor